MVFNLSTNPLNCNWGVKEHPFKNFKWLYPNFEAQNNYLIFSKKKNKNNFYYSSLLGTKFIIIFFTERKFIFKNVYFLPRCGLMPQIVFLFIGKKIDLYRKKALKMSLWKNQKQKEIDFKTL